MSVLVGTVNRLEEPLSNVKLAEDAPNKPLDVVVMVEGTGSLLEFADACSGLCSLVAGLTGSTKVRYIDIILILYD